MTATADADQIVSLSAEVIRWLFTWSWQALLLLGVTWVGLAFDRSRSATTRYRIWLIAILAVAALPWLTILSHSLHLPIALAPFPGEAIGDAAAPIPVPEAPRTGFSWLPVMWPALFALWMTGVMTSLVRLSHALWKLHLIQVRAHAVSLADLDCSYSDLLDSDTGAVSIALSESIRSPGLARLFRPVVLLPADIGSWTSREEKMSILRHELAHIKRRDQFVSLFQSVLRAVLFFHPLVRHACHQLSLERELACDDRVLGLGTNPKSYAEVILKAAERSVLTDLVHEAASFSSKRTLERRIEMILNTNRMRQPLRQWPFLVMPVMVIAIGSWLVIPAASSPRTLHAGDFEAASNGPVPVRSISSDHQTQSPPVVEKTSLWLDTVKRGTMPRQARGLGVLVADDAGRLEATIQIADRLARDIQVGQPASVDTRPRIVPAKVIHVGSAVSNGTIAVDLSLQGELPQSARAGMSVDGLIEIERLDDVLYVGRPAGKAGGNASLFRLDQGGATATRVPVKFGKSSVNVIEIIEGLKVGDQVIISDMARYDGVNTIRVH